MSADDRLANAERPEVERPRRIPPLLPDVEPPDAPAFVGSVGEEIAHWRDRALAAEALVEKLRRALARHRPVV